MSWATLDPAQRDVATATCTAKQLEAIRAYADLGSINGTARHLGVNREAVRQRVRGGLARIVRHPDYDPAAWAAMAKETTCA